MLFRFRRNGFCADKHRKFNEKREKETIGSKANNDAVLDMAKKSIVLLKNDNNLLPLKKSVQKILLLGSLASSRNSPLGSWRIAADNNTAVSVLEGMQAYKNNTLNFVEGPKCCCTSALRRLQSEREIADDLPEKRRTNPDLLQ